MVSSQYGSPAAAVPTTPVPQEAAAPMTGLASDTAAARTERTSSTRMVNDGQRRDHSVSWDTEMRHGVFISCQRARTGGGPGSACHISRKCPRRRRMMIAHLGVGVREMQQGTYDGGHQGRACCQTCPGPAGGTAIRRAGEHEQQRYHHQPAQKERPGWSRRDHWARVRPCCPCCFPSSSYNIGRQRRI